MVSGRTTVGRGVIMPLFVEECGKSRGERCRRDGREFNALRPAALTGSDGDGASGEAEGVGESSDQGLIRRPIDWRRGELHHQLPVTDANDRGATRAWGDAEVAAGTVGGWEKGGHEQCTLQRHNVEHSAARGAGLTS